MVWRGMWCGLESRSEMVFDVGRCNVKCGGNDVTKCEMQWPCVIHSAYHHHSSTVCHIEPLTFQAQHTIPHLTSHHISQSLIPPDHTSHGVIWIVWREIWCDVECFAMPDVGCCALFILMWLWCGVRCDVENVRYRCDATCDVMQCQMRCCEIWWCAVKQDAKCGCGIPSDAECNGWNAVWDGWCDLEDVLWDSVMCNLYLKCGARWNVGVMWNGVPRLWWPIDLTWIMVRCEMWCDVSVCEMWCDVECCNFRHLWCEMQKVCYVEYGVVWNVVFWYVECCIMEDVQNYDVMRNVVVWNCGAEECGICNVPCDCCLMSDVENYAKCCDASQMWWCDVKSRCGGVM